MFTYTIWTITTERRGGGVLSYKTELEIIHFAVLIVSAMDRIYKFLFYFQIQLENFGDPIELLSYLGPPENSGSDSPGTQNTNTSNTNSTSTNNQTSASANSNNDDLLALFE